MDERLERGWVEACKRHEARAAYAFAALVFGLNPWWIFIDVMLEPQAWKRFLALRIVLSAGVVPGALVVRRARRLSTIRAASWGMFVFTCVMIGWMLPGAVHHYWPYVLGFSLIVWGTGMLFPWPLEMAWHAFLMPPFIVLVAYVAQPFEHSAMELIGSGFYLVSVSIICATVAVVRYRLLRREHEASMRLEQRNDELSAALAQLKGAQARLVASEKLAALGQLLAGLSHEINNPMNVITNNIAPLRDYLVTIENLLDDHRAAIGPHSVVGEPLAEAYREAEADFIREDFHDALDGVREASERILAIHANLRSFIRGDAPTAREGDLNEGLRATVAILRRGLPRAVTIEEDYGDLAPLCARFDELNQVHFNLLQNAIDAVAGNGGIRVTTRQRGDDVEWSVSDTGPGVNAELSARIFDPFFTTKDVGQGMGLGLSICHRIVEDHGGTIAVDESYDEGARLVVRLPVSEQAGAVSQARPIGAGGRSRRGAA